MDNIQLCYQDWKCMQQRLIDIRLEREVTQKEIEKMRAELIKKHGEEIVTFVEDFAR